MVYWSSRKDCCFPWQKNDNGLPEQTIPHLVRGILQVQYICPGDRYSCPGDRYTRYATQIIFHSQTYEFYGMP